MAALNRNLQNLFTIAQKQERTGVGLMSGTSLDGLDIALCKFKGNGMDTEVQLLEFETLPFSNDYRDELKQVFACRNADLEKVCLLNAFTGKLHGTLVNQQLQSWGIALATVDFIASHGQTIYHAPKRLHRLEAYPNATLQIGDADHIAVATGIMTISDFRQKHIAAGGEGAPLALYGDVILGGKTNGNRLLLNIGGIANFTFLPAPNANGAGIICTDVGPGNTLIDSACKRYFELPYDAGGRIAFTGKVSAQLLAALARHPFFDEPFPKTTGPELFNMAFVNQALDEAGCQSLAPLDIIATLTDFTALMIAEAVKRCYTGADLEILVSGGGAHNSTLMTGLRAYLPGVMIADTSQTNIPPDAKEAILFGLLGNEAICGEPLVIGNSPAVLMGKFSFPF